MTHICVGNLTTIGSDNGLSPGRRQAITWTNVGILLIGSLGTNFGEMLIEIHTFSFKKFHLKMSGKSRPFCLGLKVLITRATSRDVADAPFQHSHFRAISRRERNLSAGFPTQSTTNICMFQCHKTFIIALLQPPQRVTRRRRTVRLAADIGTNKFDNHIVRYAHPPVLKLSGDTQLAYSCQ